MCGGSGGSGSGGRSGGGSSEAGTNGDAGQPGEVVRQANDAILKENFPPGGYYPDSKSKEVLNVAGGEMRYTPEYGKLTSREFKSMMQEGWRQEGKDFVAKTSNKSAVDRMKKKRPSHIISKSVEPSYPKESYRHISSYSEYQ